MFVSIAGANEVLKTHYYSSWHFMHPAKNVWVKFTVRLVGFQGGKYELKFVLKIIFFITLVIVAQTLDCTYLRRHLS